MEKHSLLREVAAILRDYTKRIEHLRPETLCMPGESLEAWGRKRQRIDRVLDLLERAVSASDAGGLESFLRELSRSEL